MIGSRHREAAKNQGIRATGDRLVGNDGRWGRLRRTPSTRFCADPSVDRPVPSRLNSGDKSSQTSLTHTRSGYILGLRTFKKSNAGPYQTHGPVIISAAGSTVQSLNARPEFRAPNNIKTANECLMRPGTPWPFRGPAEEAPCANPPGPSFLTFAEADSGSCASRPALNEWRHSILWAVWVPPFPG